MYSGRCWETALIVDLPIPTCEGRDPDINVERRQSFFQCGFSLELEADPQRSPVFALYANRG